MLVGEIGLVTERHPDTISVNSKTSVAVVSPIMPLDGAGGVASAHYNIYRCLKLLGCKTRLLTFNDMKLSSGETEVIRCGASRRLKSLLAFGIYCYLKMIGSNKPAYQLADIIFSIPGSLQLRRHLRVLNPDITIIPDHGAPGLSLCNKRAPIILIVHHIPARFISNPLLGDCCHQDVAKATVLEQRVLNSVNAVVCPTAYIKKVFQETYSFSGEVVVIPNMIDESLIDAISVHDVRAELTLSREVPVVYIPSAGSHLKGARYVFEIVRRLSKACKGPLGFYLSGAIDPALKAELDHAPENAFLFMPGRVSMQTNISFVKSCTFGVSPTLIENFGMALLEAGFCHVPMVTFEVGGNGEVICNGKNGLLVPFLDMERLIGDATKFLNAEYCAMIRRSTGSFVRERFNFYSIAEQYLAFCKKQIRAFEENGLR